MKFGVFGINTGPCAEPETSVRGAQAAEECGFESVWTGEHVVLPDPQAPPSPAPPDWPMTHPSIALAFLAGQTARLRLGTGIVILPQRNPVVLAKELGSLDALSGGRLEFGLGVGYLEPEFRALGVPFQERGRRADEYLEAILALWTEAEPAYRGDFVRFEGVQALPRPVQQPHPPVVIGGNSPAALRRAVTRGNGWYGFAMDPETAGRHIEGLRAAEHTHERADALGSLEISITPRAPLDPAAIRRFEDVGVHRLIPIARGRDADAQTDWVRKTADEVIARN